MTCYHLDPIPVKALPYFARRKRRPDVVKERDHLVRGYELEKGRYIQVTEDELGALEAEANSNIELKEFTPIKKVDSGLFTRAPIISRLTRAAKKRTACSPMRWKRAVAWL